MGPPPAVPRPRVLVVDDEPATRELLAEILEHQGCEARTAGDGVDAMRVLASLQGAIDLLVLDVGLPDIDGPVLAAHIGSIYGARPTLFVTGWVDEFVPLEDVPGRWAILHKPIAIPKLLEAIESLGFEWRRHDQPA